LAEAIWYLIDDKHAAIFKKPVKLQNQKKQVGMDQRSKEMFRTPNSRQEQIHNEHDVIAVGLPHDGSEKFRAESTEKKRKIRAAEIHDRNNPHTTRRKTSDRSDNHVIDVDENMENESTFSTQAHSEIPPGEKRKFYNESHDEIDDSLDIESALKSCNEYATAKPTESKTYNAMSDANVKGCFPSIKELKLQRATERPGRARRPYGHKKPLKGRPGTHIAARFRKGKAEEIDSDSGSSARSIQGNRNCATNNRVQEKTTDDTLRRLKKNGMIQSTPTDLLRDDDVWKAEGHLGEDPHRLSHDSKFKTPPVKTSPSESNKCGGRVTRSRSNRRKIPREGGNEENAITIDDSSGEDDDDLMNEYNDHAKNDNDMELVLTEQIHDQKGTDDTDMVDEPISGTRPKRWAPGDALKIDAHVLLSAKKIFRSKCELRLQLSTSRPYIMFCFSNSEGDPIQHQCYIYGENRKDLQDVKYFIPDDTNEGSNDGVDDIDDSMAFILFRIRPNDRNKLDQYNNSYDQDYDGSNANDNTGKRYIAVEARDVDDFRAMLFSLREHDIIGNFMNEGEIEFHELNEFNFTLAQDSMKERKIRLESAKKTQIAARNKNTSDGDNPLCFVFPFEIEEENLSQLAEGLTELSGNTMGLDVEMDSNEKCSTVQRGGEEESKKVRRTHYVTIRKDDVERLNPMEFLNDSLVDFWMRWISRGESQKLNSPVHFFTSHFMSTLKDDGPEAVSSWTAKKNINIFSKKIIFVPVNADLHWSLCAVINPGLVCANADVDSGEQWESHDAACILFFDSLKMHQKERVAFNIRKWLNYEWNRVAKNKKKNMKRIFDKWTMRLFTPKIPYQTNSCDCGVFVCRYAYGLYLLRNQTFTFEDQNDNFRKAITDNPAFQFDMDDIARIREEMRTLIVKLTKEYRRAKQTAKIAEIRAKREEESKKSGAIPLDDKANPTSGSEIEDKPLATSSLADDIDESERIATPPKKDLNSGEDDLINTDSSIEENENLASPSELFSSPSSLECNLDCNAAVESTTALFSPSLSESERKIERDATVVASSVVEEDVQSATPAKNNTTGGDDWEYTESNQFSLSPDLLAHSQELRISRAEAL